MCPVNLIRRFNIKKLFHFTDVSNIDSIRNNGGLLSIEALQRQSVVPARPGGNDWSHEADQVKDLHRYVHLSFMDQHPMRYIAEREGRIGPVRLLEINPEVLFLPGVLYTADVSNKTNVPSLDLHQAVEQIDFEVIYDRTNWRDPLIQVRRRHAQKAEILIPNSVPLAMIRNI